MRDLIRADKDRQNLRSLLLEGAGSPVKEAAGKAYFVGLRARVSGADAG